MTQSRAGFFFALSAFLIWGLLPFFWKLTEQLDPVEVTAHRAFWALPFALFICIMIGRTKDILPTLKSPRKLAILFCCSCLISVNWGLFIWAITVDRVLDTALAYYINPLLTIFLGFAFLGERFSFLQLMAIILAALAVLLLTVVGGKFPWISILLASTFALYGLLRKTVDVGPIQGFLVEVLIIFPILACFIGWRLYTGTSVLYVSSYEVGLMILAGPATAVPLILFALGAKRLPLSSLGLMQYIVPTMLFLTSIYIFKEPLNVIQFYAFIMIWIALVLYSWSTFRKEKSIGA